MMEMNVEKLFDAQKKFVNDLDADGQSATKLCLLSLGALAGLAAKGTTEIGEIHYIERGYDDLVGKLRGVGADITIIACPDDEVSNAAG